MCIFLKSWVFMFAIMLSYLSIAWSGRIEKDQSSQSTETKVAEIARRVGGFGIHKLWAFYGIHALSILYWLKVKAVIIAFFVGTAIVWGFRYFKNGFGCSDIVHSSPIITYDHGPAWSSGPHDHVPYSLDHSDHGPYVSSSLDHDPYSSYSGPYSEVSPTVTSLGEDIHHHGRQMNTEEQVSEIIFAFLGVANNACRKRFICEMEFRSKGNAFTRMAFRIIGRGIFAKYVNRNNANGRATSFNECAVVNSDCVFIEENADNQNENEIIETNENESGSLPQDPEQENESNLQTEMTETGYKSTSFSEDPIARSIFSRPSMIEKHI